MSKKLVKKIGYFNITEIKTNTMTTYEVDSGKLLYLKKYKKYVANPYRITKEFKTIKQAIDFSKKNLEKNNKEKIKRNPPKSLYLIILKEEKTNLLFVKVGITSKKFIINRFSKLFGYEGYTVETILRRIDTDIAEELEKKILDKLKKNKTVKKYRPILESFSGYSECFDYDSINNIINIFDVLTNKH
jgi:nitrogenase molybdenum-iron protein alpha/beta subunit